MQNTAMLGKTAVGKPVGVSIADKLFAENIVRRQSLIIRDLMALNETYPGLIVKDLVGGLYALSVYLDDSVQSLRRA